MKDKDDNWRRKKEWSSSKKSQSSDPSNIVSLKHFSGDYYRIKSRASSVDISKRLEQNKISKSTIGISPGIKVDSKLYV